MGSAAAAGRRLGTLQAGRPGRGGCERARPLRARSPRARLGGGSAARRRGNLQPQSCRPRSFVQRRRRRRRRLRIPPAGGGETRKGKKEEEEGTEATARAHSRRPRPPPGGSAVPALGLHAPPPPARPGLPATPRPPRLQPRLPGPARPARPPPPGAAGEFAASAGRAAPPRCAREPPRRPSPAEQSRERRGQPGRASGEARGDSAGPGDRERAGEEERAEEQAPGADTMPGWKKNIPICLQAEEQERGERGDRARRAGEGVWAGGRPGASLSPGSLPPVRGGRGRGAAPSWAAGESGRRLANSIDFLWGGGRVWSGGGRGKREERGAATGNFSVVPRFSFWRGLLGTRRASPGPARTWSPGRPSVSWVLSREGGGPAVLEVTSQTFLLAAATALAVSRPVAGL